MPSTPGCWAAFGILLAREYEDATLFGQVHLMTVAAYALQHPGDPRDPRTARSVWIHGVSLCLVLEHGMSPRAITRIMPRLAKHSVPELPQRPDRFAMTHADVLAAPAEEHAVLVRAWAQAAYGAWASLHAVLRDGAALAAREGGTSWIDRGG